MQWITHPSVDRVIALVAIFPFIYMNYHRLTQGFSLPRTLTIVNNLIMISTMITRRPAVRVTKNVWFWLLAFTATYGTMVPSLFAQNGQALVPNAVSNVMAILAFAIALYGRISLGRNIGLVPAQRSLVLHGAYAFVRHPIYAGMFASYIGLMLRSFSIQNLIMISFVVSLFIIKSFAEESFLKEDSTYAEYMNKVRYRWLPGIV